MNASISVSFLFPLQTFIREQTQTGRPKSIYKYVSIRAQELPETSEVSFEKIPLKKNEMPYSLLKRILLACKSKEHVRKLWPKIDSKRKNTLYVPSHVFFEKPK